MMLVVGNPPTRPGRRCYERGTIARGRAEFQCSSQAVIIRKHRITLSGRGLSAELERRFACRFLRAKGNWQDESKGEVKAGGCPVRMERSKIAAVLDGGIWHGDDKSKSGGGTGPPTVGPDPPR